METPTLFNSPDKFESCFAMADGYRTHYVEAGKDNPESLLLVHGGGIDIGMDLYRWYPVVLPLAEKFHVYAIDELGHGETDPPRDTKNLWRPTVRAEHVISFIEAMGLGPINLVGQSTGGWIVTYITIKRPDLVRKLVLIDSGSTAGSALDTEEKSDAPKQVEVDGAMVQVQDGVLPYMKEVFEEGTMHPKEGLTSTREGIRKFVSTYIYAKDMVTDEWVEHLYKFAQKWNDLYFTHKGKEFWDNTSMKEHSREFYVDGVHIRDRVHEIRTPTLVIWAKNSNKGVDPGLALYKRIPDAQLHIFDKANHFLWLDHPKDFVSLVTWYLSKS
jgi:pimeloyl-ACP methyl ester carboxylesterase